MKLGLMGSKWGRIIGDNVSLFLSIDYLQIYGTVSHAAALRGGSRPATES